MAKYVGNSSPRNTYENPKVWIIDSRILIPVLLCTLHPRWYTLGPTIIVIALLWFFEVRRAMNVNAAMRWVRSWIAGPNRPARSPGRRMKMVDYQRIGVYWKPYKESEWH